MLPIITGLITNKYTIMIASAVTIIVAAYVYYLYTSRTIERLRNEVSEMSTLLNEQRKTIKQLQEDSAKIATYNKDLMDKIDKLNKDREALRDRLERPNKTSLKDLATKKTKLVQDKINAATVKVLKCFNLITEKNKNEKDINDTCILPPQ